MNTEAHPFPLIQEPVAGVEIRLGGHSFLLPPASLYSLKKYSKAIAALEGNPRAMFEETGIDTVVGVLHAALARNHAGITVQWVGEHVGLDVVMDLFPLALDVAGLIRKQRTEGQGATDVQTTGQPPIDGGGGLGE